MLKLYYATLYFRGQITYELEGRDEEHAEERAIQRLNDELGIDVEVNDVVITVSETQYNAQQELFDEERRYDDKDKSV